MQDQPTTPYGYCQCGCGKRTTVAKCSNGTRGHVKGEPIRFVHGHHNRHAVRWVAEDRGYLTPCWVWQLHTNDDGHGRVVSDGRFVMAHRSTYEDRFGPLDPAAHLHHKCEVEPCVNPDHLEPVTPAEHRQRHARLTEADVKAIRARYAAGGITYQALADEYGVSLTMAWQIVKRQTWKNV